MKRKASQRAARDTFRQFAWNLAGTLAATRGEGKAGDRTGEKRR